MVLYILQQRQQPLRGMLLIQEGGDVVKNQVDLFPEPVDGQIVLSQGFLQSQHLVKNHRLLLGLEFIQGNEQQTQLGGQPISEGEQRWDRLPELLVNHGFQHLSGLLIFSQLHTGQIFLLQSQLTGAIPLRQFKIVVA